MTDQIVTSITFLSVLNNGVSADVPASVVSLVAFVLRLGSAVLSAAINGVTLFVSDNLESVSANWLTGSITVEAALNDTVGVAAVSVIGIAVIALFTLVELSVSAASGLVSLGEDIVTSIISSII